MPNSINGTGDFKNQTTNFGTVLNAIFSGTAENAGTVTNNATFAGSSTNTGAVSGNATFAGSASNAGVIAGDATFLNTSVNTGTILGDAWVAPSAVNSGTVAGDVNVYVALSPTPTRTSTPTVTPTSTQTPTPTATVTPTASVTPTVTPTSTVTPTVTPTATVTPTNTVTPSVTPSMPIDSNFNNTSLLVEADGSNNQVNSTFVDSSTNAYTVTTTGAPAQGTFSPYYGTSDWSGYFDGSSVLSIASSTSFDFGTGDFTIEAWVFHTGGADNTIISDQSACTFTYGAAGQLRFYTGTGQNVVNATTSFISNRWVHVAVVRSSGNITFYQDGVDVGPASKSYTANIGAGGTTYIGGYTTAAARFTGHISNLRVVKGTALYTAGFTPDTSPLVAVSETKLLTLQNNRFIDNSTNAFTLASSGAPAVQAFSPFASKVPYSASVNGGSCYFNTGQSNYCVVGSSGPVFAGDYTIEAWVYPLSLSNTYNCIASSSSNQWELLINSSGNIVLYRTPGSFVLTTSLTVPVKRWTHIALVRSGSTTKVYINGIADASTYSSAATVGSSSESVYIARDTGASSSYTGYISNFRIVNGTAVYTSNFTAPTTPLTAVSNTALLMNFTNGGIIDLAGNQNIAIAGDAKISTAQVKYGTGSMYFDGSGDYLTLTTAPLLQFGTGDFTIEMWMRRVAKGTTQPMLISTYDSATWTGGLYICAGYTGYHNDKIFVGANNVANVLTSTTTISDNTWYHVALTRSSGVFRLFVDGALEATYTPGSNPTLNGQGTSTVIGSNLYAPSSSHFNGYIDDLRITKGVARYTAAFTPPTAALPLR